MLDNFINEIKEKRQKDNEILFDMIKQEIAKGVTKYPEFIGITWKQYIPSFNDGDPCVFSICGIGFVVDFDADAGQYNSYGDEIEIGGVLYGVLDAYSVHDSEFDNENHTYNDSPQCVEKRALLDSIESALEAVSPLLQETFGNNAEVVVLSDRVIVSEYECGH